MDARENKGAIREIDKNSPTHHFRFGRRRLCPLQPADPCPAGRAARSPGASSTKLLTEPAAYFTGLVLGGGGGAAVDRIICIEAKFCN